MKRHRLQRLRARIAGALARRAGLRMFRFFARSFGECAPAAVPRDVVLRWLALPEALGYCADPTLELQEANVREAYARGDCCAAAFVGDRPAGYCWLAFSPVPHLDGVWVAFPSDAVWIYKSFVLPPFRGRGIAPALYRFCESPAIEKGRSASLVCVEAHNDASVAAALRARHAPAGRAAFLARQGSLHTWYSPAARRLDVRFHLPECTASPPETPHLSRSTPP